MRFAEADIKMIFKETYYIFMMSLCFYNNTFSQKINYLDYHGILIAPFIPDKPQQWK